MCWHLRLLCGFLLCNFICYYLNGITPCFFFLFKIYLLFGKHNYKEGEVKGEGEEEEKAVRKRKRKGECEMNWSSIHWFIPKMAAMARTAPGQSKEPEALSGSPTWVHRPKDLDHLTQIFLGTLERSWVRGRAVGCLTFAHLGLQSHRQWLSSLCHNTIPYTMLC